MLVVHMRGIISQMDSRKPPTILVHIYDGHVAEDNSLRMDVNSSYGGDLIFYVFTNGSSPSPLGLLHTISRKTHFRGTKVTERYLPFSNFHIGRRALLSALYDTATPEQLADLEVWKRAYDYAQAHYDTISKENEVLKDKVKQLQDEITSLLEGKAQEA